MQLPDYLPDPTKWIGLAILGVVGFYLLTNRSQTVVVRSNPRARRARIGSVRRTTRRSARYCANVVGVIPGQPEEYRYRRTGQHTGPYKHRFKTAARMLALSDGSMLTKPSRRGRVWGYY